MSSSVGSTELNHTIVDVRSPGIVLWIEDDLSNLSGLINFYAADALETVSLCSEDIPVYVLLRAG